MQHITQVPTQGAYSYSHGPVVLGGPGWAGLGTGKHGIVATSVGEEGS